MSIARRSALPASWWMKSSCTNQAKVTEGRKNKDLYDRLKRGHRKKPGNFPETLRKQRGCGADYFSQEIVRSLAEDDVSIMGVNFRAKLIRVVFHRLSWS